MSGWKNCIKFRLLISLLCGERGCVIYIPCYKPFISLLLCCCCMECNCI